MVIPRGGHSHQQRLLHVQVSDVLKAGGRQQARAALAEEVSAGMAIMKLYDYERGRQAPA